MNQENSIQWVATPLFLWRSTRTCWGDDLDLLGRVISRGAIMRTDALIMRTVAPVSPGEMLEKELLKPLGLSKYRLAKDIGVPPQRIGNIVAGERTITADTDRRLCRYFGLSDGWWLGGQADYDTVRARDALAGELAKIERCALLA